MENKTPFQIQRAMSVTYTAFFVSVIIAIVISSVIVNKSGPILQDADREFAEIIKYIALFVFLLHIPLAYIIPQKAIKKIDKTIPLSEKLLLYNKSLIIRFALLSSAVIFVSVVFCLIADTNLIYIAAMGLVFFLIGKPNPFKTASDLELSDDEKKQLFG
jgi:hypothetical protein